MRKGKDQENKGRDEVVRERLRKKPGGPAKREPKEGNRVALSLRMTPDLKRRLDAAAEAGGRSQSQEAEFRLERSFDRQHLLPEVMSLNYGKELAGFLMFLGNVMIWADAFHQVDNNQPRGPSHKWTWAPDADAYDQIVQGAVAVLEAMRPIDPIIAHSTSGIDVAQAIIKAVRGDPDAAESGITDNVPTIRALLGPLAERLRTEEPARNPFRLGSAVVMAANTLEVLSKGHTAGGGTITLPQDEVVEILERYLREYLVAGWQLRGSRNEGQHSEAGQKELAFEIRRRA